MNRPPNPASLRRLAKGAKSLGSVSAPERYREATGVLPDAATLIQRSHDEQLTASGLARIYETTVNTVYAVLAAAGRSREELWRVAYRWLPTSPGDHAGMAGLLEGLRGRRVSGRHRCSLRNDLQCSQPGPQSRRRRALA
jgi:hypothetical protein